MCFVPRAVYVETVERGLEAAYPDASAIRQALPSAAIHPPTRHRQAAALLEGKRGVGSGEREALHLFFRVRADAIVTDDAAFVATLMDVEDMPGSVREAGRVLEPGGHLGFCVTHPFMDAGRFASREADAAFVVSGSYLGPRRPFEGTEKRAGLDGPRSDRAGETGARSGTHKTGNVCRLTGN
jgi:hypothetical protein